MATQIRSAGPLMLLLLGGWLAAAQDKPIAFVGARVLPIDAAPIERGVMIIQGGRIAAVGAADAVTIPPNAERVDLADRVLMPGLVDTHNHIGMDGGGDRSGPLHPDVRIEDAIDVRSTGFRRAAAGGLTTINIMPGSGHLLSGQTVYIKLRANPSSIADWMIVDADGAPMRGIKMANGTNPMGEPPFPGTRGKSAALIRELYTRAIEYRERIRQAAGDLSKQPARDLGLEALGEALDGTRVVHHHTHRADDIMTVLRFAQDFKLRVVLHHVSEAQHVAEQIARAKVPCSIIVVDCPGGKLEAVDLAFETGGVLERAGVLVAFHTDDWITDARLFLRMAALAVRAGMSREGALRALTIHPATMIDLGDRVGSLTPGKDADFIVLSGDPFSVYTHVLETWVEGRRVFDRDDPVDRLHAEGGYGAGQPLPPYLCCAEHAAEGD